MRKGDNCHDDSFESVVSREEGSCRTLARVRPETSWMVLVINLGNYLRWRLMRMLRTSWVSVEVRVLLYIFIIGNSSTLRIAGTARS